MKKRKVVSLLLALLFVVSSMSMLWISVSADPEPEPPASTAPAITGFEAVADPKSYSAATSSAKTASKYFASMGFRGSNPITNALDGNWNTSAVSNTASGYANAVYVDTDGTVKLDQPDISTIQAMADNAPITYEKGQYLAFYKLSVSNAESLGSVTVWSDGSREGAGNINDAMDFYASADGEHWVLLSSYTDLCGNDSNPGANALAYLTEEKTLRNSDDTEDKTSYGLKVSVKNATVVPNYIGIAVAKARKSTNKDVIFTEITVEAGAGNDPVVDPDAIFERTYDFETPATPIANGLAVKSIYMAYTSIAFGAGSLAQEEQKKIADGSLDDVVIWRSSETLTELDPVMSIVDGKMVKYDGTADTNDYLDYIKLELVEAGNVGTIKWYVGGKTANIATKFDVYVSADGETWTLAKAVTNGTSADYVKDKGGRWCTGIEIDQNAVKFVMIAIVTSTENKDNLLQYSVQEIQLMNTSYSFADDEAFKAQASEDATTAPDTTTEAPNDGTTPAKKKKGCRSTVVGGGIAVIMLVAGAGTLAIRKKED